MQAGGAVAAALLLCLCACSRPGAPAAPVAASATEENVVNVYSWADYIAPDTVARFERETGITVHYDTFDNNEVLETKLLIGHSNYDVVLPTENYFARQLQAGVYQRLDKRLLPNFANIDPGILRRMAYRDPGNQYAVPFMWSTTGLGYNIDMLEKRLGKPLTDSWALLFDPHNAQKLSDCGILIIDSALDVFDSAIIYLHRDPNRRDPSDVQAAAEVLRQIRPFVRNIEPDVTAPLASGEACLSLTWSGDAEASRNRALEASTGARIAYLIPREGALMTLDMLAIPADAPHPRNAAIWLNYLMRPDVIASVSNYIHYPNGIAASQLLLEPAVRNDPAIYPDAATMQRLVSNRSEIPINYTRLVTRAWTRFRTGQ